MTIKASGAISIGDVNVELGIARTTNKNLGNTAVRSLLARPSGSVSLSNAYGKSNVGSGNFYAGQYYSVWGYVDSNASAYYGYTLGSISPSPFYYSVGVQLFSIIYDEGMGIMEMLISVNIGSSAIVKINGVQFNMAYEGHLGGGRYGYFCEAISPMLNGNWNTLVCG